MTEDNFEDLQLECDTEDANFNEIEAYIDEHDHDCELDMAQFLEELFSITPPVSPEQSEAHENSTIDLNLDLCNHEDCKEIDLKEIARGFHLLNVNERIKTVRAMLFALSSKEENQLFPTTAKVKRSRVESSFIPSRNIVFYALKGHKVCRKSFSEVVGLSAETVRRHALAVSESTTYEEYKSNMGSQRRGVWGVQRITVKAFLIHIANDFGMECPTGRSSKDESPVRILPSHFTKVQLYNQYKEMWALLVTEVVKGNDKFKLPDEPLSYNLFLRYWIMDFGLLKIASKGSISNDEYN